MRWLNKAFKLKDITQSILDYIACNCFSTVYFKFTISLVHIIIWYFCYKVNRFFFLRYKNFYLK